MAPPLNPQNASLSQRMALGLLRMLIGMLIVLAGAILLSGPRIGWAATSGLTGATLGFLVMIISLVPPARSAMENLQEHALPDGKHRCQCWECGRTFTPTRQPTDPRGTGGPVPQEKYAASDSGLKGYRAALVISFLGFLGLVILVVIQGVDWSNPAALLTAVVIYVALTIMLVIGMLLASRQRRLAQDRIAELDVDHGCHCRWCGATPQASRRR